MTETTDQTPEERDRLLALGKDGIVICIDMSTEEGRLALTNLSEISEDVQTALAAFGDKAPDGFLLALYIPAAISGRMIVGISAREYIQESIKMFHDRASELGNTFSFAIIPSDQSLAAMVAELNATEGSA